MSFKDSKTGDEVEAILLGFADESVELKDLNSFRDFMDEEIYPERGKSFTKDVRKAIKHNEQVRIWGLASEHHVEAVTEAEYAERKR